MAKDRFAPKPLNDVVENLPRRFQSYAKKSDDLSHYQQLLDKAISGPLSDKCHVSNYRDTILVIDADSAAVAMRLNYMKMAIMSELRKKGLAELSLIKIQTKPQQSAKMNFNPAPQKVTSKRVMSHQTADSLLELAQHAPESLKLKLQKLAEHANKDN